MANFPGQYRQSGKGPYRYQSANWKAATAVDGGDFVFQDTADANPAGLPFTKSVGSFTWTTDLATTQANVKAVFLGVSTTRRLATQTTAGNEATDGGVVGSGEFTFPCAALAAVALPGSFVGIAKAAGNALDPKKVIPVATSATAIGKVTEGGAIGATRLSFELMPALLSDLTT